MRKYDIKNKRNIGIIIGISIIIIIMFSLVIKLFLSSDKKEYTVHDGALVFDKDKSIIKVTEDSTIKKKWNNEYYLKFKDNNYELGNTAISYNEKTGEIILYGKYYEIGSGDLIDVTDGETVIKSSVITKFYKLADRKYLVVDKDIKNNILYVSTNEEKFLFSKRIVCKDFNWISGAPESRELRCKAKVRYRQDDQPCTLKITHDGVEFIFDEPQRAVAKGQFAVAYDGDICLGGGEITDILRD